MDGDQSFFLVTRANQHKNGNGASRRAELHAPAPIVSPPTAAVTAQAHAGEKTADLSSGDAASFPTWSFWGVTNGILTNTSNVPVFVTLQVGAGGVQAYTLQPQGQPNSIQPFSGAWAGFPLWVKNETQEPSSLHVEVW